MRALADAALRSGGFSEGMNAEYRSNVVFAEWTQKRGLGGGRNYRVESGNDMGGETANAFVDAAMRRKARQGLEPRK